jgi:hypothetical protein
LSHHEVHVLLLDEGTQVWRPVPAVRLAEGVYRLAGVRTADEQWEFEPGSVVRCVHCRFNDGTEGWSAVALADPSQ